MRTAKTKRSTRTRSIRKHSIDKPSSVLHQQFSEIAILLVRILKGLGFDDKAIMREFSKAAVRQKPRPLRAVPVDLAYCSRILARWAEDPDYINEYGRPRDLYGHRGPGTFHALVESELPGESPKDCLRTLLATGSVIRLPRGLIRWRSRTALGLHGRNVFGQEVLRPLTALLATLESNLAQPTTRSRDDTFQRGVCGFEIPEAGMASLRRLIEHHGMGFIELVDNWLSQQSRAPSDGKSPKVRPYVGVFMIADVRQGARRVIKRRAASRRIKRLSKSCLTRVQAVEHRAGG